MYLYHHRGRIVLAMPVYGSRRSGADGPFRSALGGTSGRDLEGSLPPLMARLGPKQMGRVGPLCPGKCAARSFSGRVSHITCRWLPKPISITAAARAAIPCTLAIGSH